MALLTLLIDRVQLASLNGPTVTTYNHSLQTTPDFTLANLRSVASASANNSLFAVGANASIATVGVAQPSAAVAAPGVVAFDVWNIYWSGGIR